MRSRDEIQDGPLIYSGKVRLARAQTFYHMDQRYIQSTRSLSAGARVRVREAERLYNDHGRFDRWWYRAEIPGTWFRAVLEEDAIALLSTSAVDQLAEVGRKP